MRSQRHRRVRSCPTCWPGRAHAPAPAGAAHQQALNSHNQPPTPQKRHRPKPTHPHPRSHTHLYVVVGQGQRQNGRQHARRHSHHHHQRPHHAAGPRQGWGRGAGSGTRPWGCPGTCRAERHRSACPPTERAAHLMAQLRKEDTLACSATSTASVSFVKRLSRRPVGCESKNDMGRRTTWDSSRSCMEGVARTGWGCRVFNSPSSLLSMHLLGLELRGVKAATSGAAD